MDDPTEIGRLIGVVFWAGVSILGIIKCLSIARRETTSTLCVHSLTLMLAAYVVMQLIAVLKSVAAPGLGFMLGMALLGLGAFLLLIVSLTLAIVGLVLYRRSYAPDGTVRIYRQGRKQAVWAIVLSSIFILIMTVSFIGGLTGRTLSHNPARQAGKPEYVVDEMNFRLVPPAGNWLEMDAKTLNPESSLLIMRGNPHVYATVIAERPGIESGMTVEQLVEVAHSNTRSVASDTVFSAVAPRTINGLDGLSYSVDATVGSFSASYVSWCAVTNGFCYQVTLWASRRDREALHRQADAVLQGFHLIDPARRSYSSGDGAFGMRGSSFFGYSIDLQETGWLAWKNLQDSDRLADYGGIHPEGARFSVTPVMLPYPDVSEGLVHEAFLKLYEYAEPVPEDQQEPLALPGLRGLAYSYSNSENRCIEQLLISTNCAYLVSVWSPLSQAGALPARAEEVFAAVTYSQPEGRYESLHELPPDRLAVQATMINKVGLGYYHAGRYEEALGWFRAGFDCDATNAVYFGNILAAHSQLNRSEEGLTLLAAAAPSIRQVPSIRSWQAALLSDAGRIEEADKVYGALFESGYREDDDFIAWTRLRADNGMWEELDTLFSGYMGSRPTTKLQLHQLDLYFGKGDYEKAVGFARGFLERQGFSPDIAYRLIDALQELGQYNEALGICDELLEKGYETVNAYQEKALCEYRLNWYRQSKESLEKALALNSRNETTQEWLATVSAELGEGDNSSLKHAIEPVQLPPVFLDELQGSAENAFSGDFGACYERLWVLWQFEKDTMLKRTDVYQIQVLDSAGVSAFSSLEFGFNPVRQEIFVNKLLVRSKAGDIIGRGAVRDYYILDDGSDGLVSENKKLVLPVPGLEAGCTIEVAVTRAYLGGPDEFYFKRHYLAAGYPVRHAAVFLAGDARQVAAVGLNGAEEIRNGEGILWINAGPCIYKREPMQLPVERFLPNVVLGPAGRSWMESATNYLARIHDRLGGGGALDARAKELTEGCSGEEEKYAAVVNWIRSAFTYKPLEFGRSASIPDTAAATLSYRYGDCKDLSVLLKVLLEAVGVECHLALVHSSNDICTEIVTTDQFNHMIVYLPGIRGGLFVDPTDQEADAFLAVPQGLHQKKALVLDPVSPRLTTLPELARDSSACSIRRTIAVRPDAPVEITDRVTLQGYYAAWMRNALKDRQRVKWVEWFQSNLADFVTGLEVRSVGAEHLHDASRGLQLELTYTLSGIVQDEADAALEVPPLWVRYYLSFPSVQERCNPFRVNYPLRLELTVEGDPAEGFRFEPPLLCDAGEAGRFIEWKVTGQSRFTCQLKKGEFKAAEYAGFIDAVNGAIQAAYIRTGVMSSR